MVTCVSCLSQSDPRSSLRGALSCGRVTNLRPKCTMTPTPPLSDEEVAQRLPPGRSLDNAQPRHGLPVGYRSDVRRMSAQTSPGCRQEAARLNAPATKPLRLTRRCNARRPGGRTFDLGSAAASAALPSCTDYAPLSVAAARLGWWPRAARHRQHDSRTVAMQSFRYRAVAHLVTCRCGSRDFDLPTVTPGQTPSLCQGKPNPLCPQRLGVRKMVAAQSRRRRAIGLSPSHTSSCPRTVHSRGHSLSTDRPLPNIFQAISCH